MKKTALFLLATLSLSSFAQNLDRQINQKIEILQNAQRNGDIARLSQGEQEILNRGLVNAISVLRSNPVPPTQQPPRDWRNHPSYNRNKVELYSDDSCGRIVTEVLPRDNCGSLSSVFGHSNVWSVKINNRCVDIADTTFSNICAQSVDLALSQAPAGNDLEIFSDDSCSRKVTDIDPRVNCSALSNVLQNQKVWSVRLFGQCVDIPDTTLTTQRCEAYQDAVLAFYDAEGSRRRGDDVELFSDDSCGRRVTTVKKGMDCRAVNGVFTNQNVWSVRFRGQCVDIPDTKFLNACESFSR